MLQICTESHIWTGGVTGICLIINIKTLIFILTIMMILKIY